MRNDEATSELLVRVSDGSSGATQELMQMYRARLRRMVHSRLDSRLSGRLDASDVLQDVLLTATAKLPSYAEAPSLPFYVWLRQLALDQLSELYRRHVCVEKRSVTRESLATLPVSDDSVDALAANLRSREPSPSEDIQHRERRDQTRAALDTLSSVDRELLLMRYVERMPFTEIAALISLSLSATKSRHLRALDKLSGLLGDEGASS